MGDRMKRILGAGLAVLLAGTAAAPAQEASDRAERRFEPSREAFANPGRGFYSPRMSHRMGELEGVRKQGMSLLMVEMDLRDFKERELTSEKLDELRRAFARVRENGLKVIFRAAYGFTGRDYRADPRDLDRILGHIRQLGVVFGDERDVLYGIQAGFLGPWGEWHGSNWGNPPSLEARRAVLFGLLDAAPAPITVSIRRPMFIRDIFAGEPGGSTLTSETAYSGSRLSRTGWHDDALLSLPTDMGSFAERGWNRERELAWCDNHGRFTPFGGETVPPSAKTPIDQVVRELERFHATYLNIAYHGGTLNGWRKAEYQGENAFAHIERRLGYRFEPTKLSYTRSIEAGGTLDFVLELKNVGFASPHFPVEAAAVLTSADRVHRVVLPEADPRRWDPGAGVIALRGKLTLPGDLPRGPWRLAIHLADPSPKLKGDARYAIRLAGREVQFDDKTGWNIVAEDITVH